ncbi:methyltransferase domain-containing protein [Saccharothrix violaceirubra]|uniref:Protein-L-isoaspartate O-methyltransferase n=1 Tax=Saccharothrix violaceirubra TaxID=413306 RepID=A0A7W7WT54_9PSEU|nr:methyltransferase domain-containing protein [Saccharothrix violaceirubra]MBB4962719.1 protein-L-isoaspartate(D-aspartate) O-methyltransferase [Saccharothrix violaceirubra]
MDRATRLRHELVDHLVSVGALRTPRWVDAFRQVPRHVFLRAFFVRHDDGSWSAVTDEHPDHLDLVYADNVLVTQLGGTTTAWQAHRARGTPTSSSSMPVIMAIMLEALAPEPGARVLEIGTGTGYNAALLAQALDDKAVTSVDVDPEVLTHATESLALAGHAPRCVLGDGEQGHPPDAPYTHILGTCAVDRVPPAWLAQAAPGGVVVTTLNRSLGAGLVRLAVHDGVGTGPVLADDGRFMPLRAHTPTWADALLAEAREGGDVRLTELPGSTVVDPTAGFEFFAGVCLPGVVAGLDPVRLVAPDGSWARQNGAGVAQSGDRRLWDEVEAAYRTWLSYRRPRRAAFTYTATPTEAYFTHPPTGRTWPA